MKAFAVLNEAYLDQAIISLNSFFKYNSGTSLVLYVEKGGNYTRLKNLIPASVEFREVEFPKHSLFDTVGGSNLLIPRESMPAIAQRIVALEELSKEDPVIMNFDLDTLFLGTVSKAVTLAGQQNGIYGVSERENRNKWIKNLHLTDPVTCPLYFNTGFIIYNDPDLCVGLYDAFLDTLRSIGNQLYCPEQDFVNLRFPRKYCLREHYNAMFTSRNYHITPLMVHYLGVEKPWSDVLYYQNYEIYRYFPIYLTEASKLAGVLSDEFMVKVQKNCQKV